MMRATLTGIRRRVRRRISWWRHAYRFNWAHKPLWDRFAGDLLRIGRVHLCRSCTLLYGGPFASGMALLLFDAPVERLRGVLAPLLIITVALSHPVPYRRMPRGVRDLLRLSTGVLIALCVGLLVRGEILTGLASGAILFVVHRVYMRGRPERKRHACDGCDELAAGGICSGSRQQAIVVRRYQDQLAAARTEELRRRLGTVRPAPGPQPGHGRDLVAATSHAGDGHRDR